MVVGRLNLTVTIPSAQSLKEKRRVIKSLIARIRNQHNAAIAEVGDNDKWQICRLGAAVVSNRRDHANSLLSSMIKTVERDRTIVVIDYDIEID